jgi:hypothetical protein
MVHQIKNTGAQVILAHPTMVKTAIAAAEQSGLPKSRIYQFSDEENSMLQGVKDWRHLVGTPEQGEQYSWNKLSAHESENTVATINYSSGTFLEVFFPCSVEFVTSKSLSSYQSDISELTKSA